MGIFCKEAREGPIHLFVERASKSLIRLCPGLRLIELKPDKKLR